METNTEQMLRDTLELTRENNRMLHSMRRTAFIGGLFKIVFWVIIIGGPILLYQYVLQPYIDQLNAVKSQVEGISGTLGQLPPELVNVLKNLGITVPGQ